MSRVSECWNTHSQDYTFLGTLVPGTVRSLELSFQVPWTFPVVDHLFICHRAVPGPLTKKKQRNKQKRRPMTATVHSRYTQTVDRRYSASHLNRFSSSERLNVV